MTPSQVVNVETNDFRVFFNLQYGLLVRDARFIVGDYETAKDLAQEALAKTFLKWNKVQHLDNPGTWARRITINLALDHKKKKWFRGSKEEAVPSSEELVAMQLDVRSAIGLLPPMQKAVILLHYFDDYPIQETAAILSKSEGTIKAQLHTARQRLAELLSDYASVSKDRANPI